MTVKVSPPSDAATAGFEIEIELKYTLLYPRGNFVLGSRCVYIDNTLDP